MSSRPDQAVQQRLLAALDEAARMAERLVEGGREYLASEQGREVRRRLATALMFAAPVLGELPVLRRTPAGRLLRFAGASALVVKGAEWLRDWEPASASRT